MTKEEIKKYIEKAEEKGRKKFIKFLKLKGIELIKEYPIDNDFDITFTAITKNNETKTYLVEIKDREDIYTGSTFDMLIEYDKLIKLKVNRVNNNYDKCLYVFTFNNSAMIKISDVTNTNLEGFVLQKQQRNNYLSGDVYKMVKYLNNYIIRFNDKD